MLDASEGDPGGWHRGVSGELEGAQAGEVLVVAFHSQLASSVKRPSLLLRTCTSEGIKAEVTQEADQQSVRGRV